MNKIFNCLLALNLLLTNLLPPSLAEDGKKKKTIKAPVSKDISWSSDEEEELIPVIVRNEFDEDIKIKFDTNREYPIGPHEGITLGKRKPGRYTLTVYTKKGEFVDNVTRTINKNNKFVLNKNTVVNANKITNLTAGQKVAITAGAIGAAAVGAALVNKALQGTESQQASDYVPPPYIPPVVPQNQVAQEIAPVGVTENNAFNLSGNSFKFLNSKYEQVTLVVEGTDGNPIGNNWIIPKATAIQKLQPLIFNDKKITIGPDQIVKAVLSDGKELQRYAFELEKDLVDGSYVWVIK